MTSDSSTATRPPFILVDGHSLAFRSYYAFSKAKDGGLRTSMGIPTSICFGFLKSLLEVISSQQPQAMAVAFDLGSPTFRHEAEATYKAGRKERPEDFILDLENLRELLAGLNLPILTEPGYEADDILGTLAQQASAAGYQVKIITGDRDLFQLVDGDKNISVLYLSPEGFKRSSSGNGINEFFTEQVQGELGVLPSQVIDYKALCGDKSDNIPGVRGIGEKTAVKLLNTYGSLENIYQSVEEIKGAVKTKLVTGKEDAEKSRYLATIVLDVPIEVELDSCKLQGFDSTALIPILEKLEFKSFLEKINHIQQQFGGTVIETSLSSPDNEDDDLSFFSPEDTAANSKQPDIPIQPLIINTEAKLTELVQKLHQFTNPDIPVAWDTETSDLKPRDAKLVGIGCCWGIGIDETAYIPVGHQNGTNLRLDTVLSALRPILEGKDYPKTFQNAKFDRLVFRVQGIKLDGVVFDPMLASYVLNPDNSHNLSDLSLRYLGLIVQNYKDLVPKGQTIDDIDIVSVANYCCLQVYATFQLVGKLREELVKIPSLHTLLLEVEQPLEPVLAEVESRGIKIDSEYLQEFSQQLTADVENLEKQVHEIAGQDFNLGSPKQLSQILFEKLGLSTKHSRKIKTGYSTDAATLEKMRDDDKTGIIDGITEYRTLAKLKSTYVDALPNLVRSDTHRVHSNFNQTATSTGRLSSSNPNLQNIPIRTAFSRQIRKAFLPEPGWLIVAADYSQIELRILAHLSQEPLLVEAYRNNEDIHTVTARLMFEKDEVTTDDRRIAKTINFGVIYGMGSLKLSRSIGVEKKLANEFIQKFYTRYPRLFTCLELVKKQAIAQGFVETILGRRRYFPFTSNSLQKLKGSHPDEIDLCKLKKLGAYDAGLLRSAANAPIQGSSADIIKVAMIEIHQVLEGYQARLLLQVHDELVLEVPPEEWEELQIKIKSVMENAIQLDVPLIVDVHQGKNWMETK
ncbi:DNA polymerase I [Richelia intracellularis]|nr:DNA polymerase I [Richelia intracellularis]